jgi:hypothetical protein
MTDDAADLEHRLAEITQTLRLQRSKVAGLERFAMTTTLRDVSVVPDMKQMKTAAQSRAAPKARLPPEFAASLMSARDELKAARDETAALEKKKKAAAAELSRANASVADTTSERAAAVEVTGWGSPTARHYRDPMERDSSIELLKREILELSTTEKHLATHNQRLAVELHSTTEQLMGLEDLDWDVFRMKAEVNIKLAQLASVKDEIDSVRRIYTRKQALLDRETTASNAGQVLALEADKNVAQQRLAKHQEASRLTEAATRHRALQIRQREERLRFYGDAIREVLQVEQQEDDVPAEQIDDIRDSITASRKREAELQAALDFLDAQVSNLEARVEILVRATMTLETEEETDEQSFLKRSAAMHRDFKQQRNSAVSMVSTQRQSVSAKESKLTELKSRQASKQRTGSQQAQPQQ